MRKETGPGAIPMEEYQKLIQRGDNLLSRVWGTLRDNRYISFILLAALGLFGYEAFIALNVHNSLERGARDLNRKATAASIVPLNPAEVIAYQVGRTRFREPWEVLTTQPGRIQVEVLDGINVRDAQGERVQTGLVEPFYSVEQETGYPVPGEISNYVIDYDFARVVKRISAVRWVRGGEDNGGLGHPEFIAVYDRDVGCLVSFTNPNAALCSR